MTHLVRSPEFCGVVSLKGERLPDEPTRELAQAMGGATPFVPDSESPLNSSTGTRLDLDANRVLTAYAHELKPGQSISGEEMMRLIMEVISDPDNDAAAGEYNALTNFVRQNLEHLSPEALEVFAAYKRAAKASQDEGDTGISFKRIEAARQEMIAICGGRATHVSEALKTDPSPYTFNSDLQRRDIPSNSSEREKLSTNIAADLERLKAIMKEHPECYTPASRAFDALHTMKLALVGIAEQETINKEMLDKVEREQDERIRESSRLSLEGVITRLNAEFQRVYHTNRVAASRELEKMRAIIK